MRRVLAIGVFVALTVVPLSGQSVGEEQSTEIAVRIPSSFQGGILPDAATEEGRRGASVRGEFWLGTDCTDDPGFSAAETGAECMLMLNPVLSVSLGNPRSQMSSYYRGAFNRGIQHSNSYDTEQSFGVDLEHRFSRRLTVDFEQFFDRRNTSLTPLQSNGSETGLMEGLNDAIVAPAEDRTTLSARLATSYRLSKFSVVGISATYSDVKYENVDVISELPRTRVGSLSGIYSHLLGRRHWIGVNYNFQHLRWGDVGWEGSHSFLYTHTVALNRWLIVSAFGGPEYTVGHLRESLSSKGTSPARWIAAYGGTLIVGSGKTTFEVSAVHRVTDGGGLTGIAVLGGATADFSRTLSPKLTLKTGAGYGVTRPMYDVSKFNSVSAQGGIEYRAASHVLVKAQYGHEWQQATNGFNWQNIDRNRFAVAIGYSFGLPLGR